MPRGLSLDYDRPFVTIYLNDPAITREMHRHRAVRAGAAGADAACPATTTMPATTRRWPPIPRQAAGG